MKGVIIKKNLVLAMVLGTEILNATSTKDYDLNHNKFDFNNYGYSNPIDGFVGSYLAQPFDSSHYFYGKSHLGADFMTSAGTNVYSICDGKIIESQDMTYQVNVRHRNNYKAYYNSRVIIQCHQDTLQFLAIYGHVDEAIVRVGSNVTKGQLIAHVAPAYESNLNRNYGNDHLHFGININNKISYSL